MPNSSARAIAGATCAALLASCASPAAPGTSGDDRLHVVTTFTVIADMARVVGGEHVRVESVVKPGAEIHGYEPTPGDLARAQGADLVLDNGLGLEAWFAQLLSGVDAPHATLSDGVPPLPIVDGEAAGEHNPHAWMSPRGGQVYVRNIAAALADVDPTHAELYAANADAYAAELEAIHDDLVAALADRPGALLVTCEGAFSYLARDAGLGEAYLWPVNSEGQATVRGVIDVVDQVRATGTPAVFCESTVSDAAQRQVAAETGAHLAGPLYVDSLSGADGPVPTYLDLLRHDTRVIASALEDA